VNNFSPAGMSLFATSAGVAQATGAPAETDEERRKRLLAVAQQQNRLSAAGNALGLGTGGYGTALGGN
jgi:hypothetical protein